MQKYRIAVCEDDKIVRDEICRVCDSTLEEEKIAHDVFPFSNAEELEAVLKEEGWAFDLLVLDIKLENKTGLELAQEVRRQDDTVGILFITGYEQYALSGYAVQPVHFLLKPLDWQELKRAVMTDWRKNHRSKTVFLEKGRRHVRLSTRSILYVEPDGSHGVRIVLEDGNEKFPAGMAEIEQMLPQGQFVRCHNSYIVNLEHVRECSGQAFRLDKENRKIPISRKYFGNCQNAFVSYMNH